MFVVWGINPSFTVGCRVEPIVAGLTPNSKSAGSFMSVPKITLASDLHGESWTADR